MVASADYVTPGTVVAGKAALSLNGGTSAASTNSMAAISGHPGVAKLELTATELSGYGILVVSAVMGASLGNAEVEIVAYDPFTRGYRSPEVAKFEAGR